MPRPSHDSRGPVQVTRTRATDRYRQVLMPEAMQAADTVTRYYVKRRLPVSEDDIRNHAFLVAVESVDDYDPAKGDVVPYMFEAARTAVGMAIARWLNCTSVSDSAIKKGVRNRAVSTKLTPEGEEVDILDLMPDASPTPEDFVDGRRAAAAHRAAKACYEAALRRLLAEEFSRDVARALEAVAGIGRGRQRTIDEAAQRARLEAKALRRELHRFRGLVWSSATLGALRRDVERAANLEDAS